MGGGLEQTPAKTMWNLLRHVTWPQWRQHRLRTGLTAVGIMLGVRDQWGKGLGTDAMQTLVAWGFYTLNLNRVQLRVFADNERAIRSYQKVGFQIEGRLRQGNYANGAYRDVLYMGVLREDWAQALMDAKAE